MEALLEGSKQARLLKSAHEPQTVQLLKHMNQDRNNILENLNNLTASSKSELNEISERLANCDVEAVKKAVKFVIQDKIGHSGESKWHWDRL